MNKLTEWLAFAVVSAAIVAAIAALLALPVMLLWDAVMPELFGLKEITFFQALWLTLLCGFLFKSSVKAK